MGKRQQLAYKVNSFGGVVVIPSSLPDTGLAFDEVLQEAISVWRQPGNRTVWLEIPRQKAYLISAAIELGFEFHHCQAEYLMLTYRLIEGSFLPPYATHYAGVGGVVLNEAKELLVVVEQADREDRPNYYKLPGGALQSGEHIVDAAIREVKEETGVNTRFESLVCIRHWHKYRYGKSDLYFVCRLSPLANQITVQPSEIYKCEWMTVTDFLQKESVGVFSKRIVECALQGQGMRAGWLEGYDQDQRMREILLPS